MLFKKKFIPCLIVDLEKKNCLSLSLIEEGELFAQSVATMTKETIENTMQ